MHELKVKAVSENRKGDNTLGAAHSKDSRILKLLKNGAHSIQRRIRVKAMLDRK